MFSKKIIQNNQVWDFKKNYDKAWLTKRKYKQAFNNNNPRWITYKKFYSNIKGGCQAFQKEEK